MLIAPGRVLEQARLGGEVVLHVGMEVEVILGQVGEAGGGEADAGDTLELERVRRHLHGAGAVAGGDHPPQRRLQVDALGRRPRHRLDGAADPRLDRAQHPGRALGRLQDRLDEVDGGGLAVRAGHADDAQLGARIAEERGRRGGHRPPRRVDDELGHVDLEHALDDQRDGSVFDRDPGEVVPVGHEPRHAHVQGTRPGGLGPVGDGGDVGLPSPVHRTRPDGLDQRRELHRRGER